MESQARTFGMSLSGLDGGYVLADVVNSPDEKTTGSSFTSSPKRQLLSLRVHCRAARTFTGLRCAHSPHASRNACQSMASTTIQPRSRSRPILLLPFPSISIAKSRTAPSPVGPRTSPRRPQRRSHVALNSLSALRGF